MIEKLLAQADQVVGTIENKISLYGSYDKGLILFFSNILRLIFVVAGIYAFTNFILAGFQYMNAGGDSKALSSAWSSIWQSLLGLVIIVGSFALAGLFGYLFFGDAGFILNPKVYGPK